ncbi:MAG: hypothetical protein ACJ72D_23810 [Marmoricola sp.]
MKTQLQNLTKKYHAKNRKQLVAVLVAVVAIVAAVVVGGVALLSRSDGGAATEARNGATDAPSAAAPPARRPKNDGLKIPKGIVNPLSGKTYCATAKLLAVYAHQPYGLDKKLQVVDGKKFDTRLRTVAAAYQRLADQAPAQPRTGNVAKTWAALATTTSTAEKRLRVSGLKVQSQGMVVALAKMASATSKQLPHATSTLKSACGLSPSIFGL